MAAGPARSRRLAGGTIAMGTHLLVAVGRVPNIAALNLDAAGIAHTRAGVTVDPSLRTSNRRVYAIGDVAGQGSSPTAGYHAGVIIRSILFGLRSRARADHVPRVTFTIPNWRRSARPRPRPSPATGRR
ncbi:MAG: FAD-dependent oxidoreductase [Paracoccaceae bacterium]